MLLCIMSKYKSLSSKDRKAITDLINDLPQERFWKKVDKTKDCQVWTGNLCQGYGRFSTEGKSGLAHRYSYKISIGPIPKGLLVTHKCHNKSCVNPDHLVLRTNAENIADNYNNPRWLKSKLYTRSLKDGEVWLVKRIGSLNITITRIATMFKVSPAAIWKILKGRTYKEV